MLNAKLSPKFHAPGTDVYFSFSPQRSGQHLMISWLCLGLDTILHVNHVRVFAQIGGLTMLPMAGRVSFYDAGKITDTGKRKPRAAPAVSRYDMPFDKEFWTTEDIAPDNWLYRNHGLSQPKRLFVMLRDPANWLASSFRHGKWTDADFRRKVKVYEQTLRFYREHAQDPKWVFLNFNAFVADPAYRRSVSDMIDEHDFDRAEPALDATPDFGGGSSFAGLGGKAGVGVSDRWRDYANDPKFRALLSGSDLRENAAQYFGEDHLAFLDTAPTASADS